MTDITVHAADRLFPDDEIAGTARSTPDGRVPGGIAGYIVGECTVLCADCGREHPDVKPHDDGTEPHEYSYDYIESSAEWDYGGATCEQCLQRLNTNILVYHDGGPSPERVVTVTDPDGTGREAEAYVLRQDGREVRIMLAEDFRPYGEQGDTSWIPVSDVATPADLPEP